MIIVIRWYKRVKSVLHNHDEIFLGENPVFYIYITKVYILFSSGAFGPSVMAGFSFDSGTEAEPVMGRQPM